MNTIQSAAPDGRHTAEQLCVCGVQSNVVAWRLKDVPELGYSTSDKPYPRGELLVRTHCSVPGYFKQPKVVSFSETF